MAKIIRNKCECGELKDHRSKVCKTCLWKMSDLDLIDEKKCGACKRILPISNFRLRIRFEKVRPRSDCRECERKDCLRRSKIKNPPKPKRTEEEKKLNTLKSLIRVRLRAKGAKEEELDFYLENFLNQKDCPICSRPLSEMDKMWGIDHCHTTGKIRGFLCSACNTGLGMFRDKIPVMEKAIEYLKNEGIFNLFDSQISFQGNPHLAAHTGPHP